MARNPDAPPSRAQVLSQAASRHTEGLALIVGIILGAGITLLGVLVGG